MPLGSTIRRVAVLRMFASAREAAGTGMEIIDADTVGDVLDRAVERHGAGFAAVLGTCKVWLNGAETERSSPVTDSDEVAVLPPVSGGCR